MARKPMIKEKGVINGSPPVRHGRVGRVDAHASERKRKPSPEPSPPRQMGPHCFRFGMEVRDIVIGSGALNAETETDLPGDRVTPPAPGEFLSLSPVPSGDKGSSSLLSFCTFFFFVSIMIVVSAHLLWLDRIVRHLLASHHLIARIASHSFRNLTAESSQVTTLRLGTAIIVSKLVFNASGVDDPERKRFSRLEDVSSWYGTFQHISV